MKKGLIFIVVIVFLGGGLLCYLGKDQREIVTEIEIMAPPGVVWSILVDVEKWSHWSPIITSAKGIVAVNGPLEIVMTGDEGKEGARYQPIVSRLDEEKVFSWQATMMAECVFTNGKILELQPTENGTRVIHRETFQGMMVPLMWNQVETHVPQMLNAMNSALKNKAESQ